MALRISTTPAARYPPPTSDPTKNRTTFSREDGARSTSALTGQFVVKNATEAHYINCDGEVKSIDKGEFVNCLAPNTQRYFDRFWRR